MSASPRLLFISWIDHHGRSDGLARWLGAAQWSWGGGTGPFMLRHLRLTAATWRLLRRVRPRAVIVMQPPFPALLTCWIALRPRGVKLIADMHTGAFLDPKWRWSLGPTVWLLRRGGAAIVTNEFLAAELRSRGVETVVVHDLVEYAPEIPLGGEDRHAGDLNEFVLCPLAYASDEPLEALLSAARLTPNRNWVWTGRAPDSIMQDAPDNVRFTGFVPFGEYQKLMAAAAVVVAPTLAEHTMQRAGYEALNSGKALVTARTRVLCEYFGASALYAAADGDSYAQQVELAISTRSSLERKMRELRDEKLRDQERSLRAIHRLANGE